MIEKVIEWKYGLVADTENEKITAWRHPSIAQPSPEQLLLDTAEYQAYFLRDVAPIELRRKSYDPTGDQLDRITKFIKFMKENGVEIGPDGEEQVAHVEAVKEKYPKSGV